MTSPRDPIEAPATPESDRTPDYNRGWADGNASALDACNPIIEALQREVAAARDEGRREAVREIRNRFQLLGWIGAQSEVEAYDPIAAAEESYERGRSEGYWQGVHDGQHKSRSSDPTEADDEPAD